MPGGVLIDLVTDEHWSVRWEVAEHPNAGPLVWAAVLASEDAVTRKMLARVPGLDASTTAALLCDPAKEVRQELALLTPDPAVLETLMRDPAPSVRAQTALNEIVSPNQIRVLARDRSAVVRVMVAQAPRVPPDVYADLAGDRSINVRWSVATMPHTPRRVLQTLAADAHPDVANQARGGLEDSR